VYYINTPHIVMIKQGLIQIETKRARRAKRATHLLGLTAGAYVRVIYGHNGH
jgi:hypothetical protein